MAASYQENKALCDELLAMIASEGLPPKSRSSLGDRFAGGGGGGGGLDAARRSSSPSSSAGAADRGGDAGLDEVLPELDASEEGGAEPSSATAAAADAEEATTTTTKTKSSAPSSSSSAAPPQPSASSPESELKGPALFVLQRIYKEEVFVFAPYAKMVPHRGAALQIVSDVFDDLASDKETAKLIVSFFSVVFRLYKHLESKGVPNALGVAVLDALPFLEYYVHCTGKNDEKKAPALFFAVAAHQLKTGRAVCSSGEAIKAAKEMGVPSFETPRGVSRCLTERDPLVADVLRRHVHDFRVSGQFRLSLRALCGCCDWAMNGGRSSAA